MKRLIKPSYTSETEPSTSEPSKKGQRTVQSVERALDILEQLAEAHDPVPLNELSSRVGLNVSTCHHLLATMVTRGYVERVSRSRGYALGPRITYLSDSRLKQFNLLDLAMPELRHLNSQTRESVHLVVLQGMSLVTLASLESKFPVRVGFDEGIQAEAAHATATGKAILAWLPEPEIARVIAHGGLKKYTDHTILTIADLVENLRLVRRHGFALDNEEFQVGVLCVGTAIRDHNGAVIGAISCSMPRMRAEGDHYKDVCSQVINCASKISEKLGAPTSSPPSDLEG